MLQFFDDLPADRWAALVHVEKHAREAFLKDSSSADERRGYVQMILVAAHELQLRILPKWQSEFGLLYHVAGLGLGGDKNGKGVAAFERDLAAVTPKIKELAKRGTATWDDTVGPLDLGKDL